MDELKIKITIEMAWRIACDAHLPGAKSGMLADNDQFNRVRWEVFLALVRNLTVPREFNATVTDPKEPWQS